MLDVMIIRRRVFGKKIGLNGLFDHEIQCSELAAPGGNYDVSGTQIQTNQNLHRPIRRSRISRTEFTRVPILKLSKIRVFENDHNAVLMDESHSLTVPHFRTLGSRSVL